MFILKCDFNISTLVYAFCPLSTDIKISLKEKLTEISFYLYLECDTDDWADEENEEEEGQHEDELSR